MKLFFRLWAISLLVLISEEIHGDPGLNSETMGETSGLQCMCYQQAVELGLHP